MAMSELALLALVAFAASVAVVPLCGALARRLGYMARPRSDRWHRRPVALFGGVGIALSVLLLHQLTQGAAGLPLLVSGSASMFALGLIDDLVSLRPYTKLIGEVAIAAVFVSFGYRLHWADVVTLDALLTMAWIVGLTNAHNLLDNMDGLCAGVALIAGTALLVAMALDGGIAPEARYLALLLGALAGFLFHNYPPASIIMGDSGSLFVGLNLAVLALIPSHAAYGSAGVPSTMAAPVLVLLVPIFDTALVTISRLMSGRSVVQGGRDHSSHRLVALGLSERSAVAVLWVLAALGGWLGVAVRNAGADWAGVAAAVFVAAMVIFAVYLLQIRVYDEAPPRCSGAGAAGGSS